MNGEIIRVVSLNGPSLIYHVARELASSSETKIHYPTVNRRVHDLEERRYLRKSGSRLIKSGAEAALYETTIRGDFAALAVGLSQTEQRKLVGIAGEKPTSPFMLLKLMLEAGIPYDVVQRELLEEVADAVKNGYINLEALDEEVICSAFATSIARRLRIVLGDERGREYVEGALHAVQALTRQEEPAPPKKTMEATAMAGAQAPAAKKMMDDLITNYEMNVAKPMLASDEPPRETGILSPAPKKKWPAGREHESWTEELDRSLKEILRS